MASSKGFTVWLVLIVIIAGFAGMALMSVVRSCALEPYDVEARRLASLVTVPAVLAEIPGGYTTGRILTVDLNGGKPRADRTFMYLPNELKAVKTGIPAAQTVVLLRYRKDTIGSYSDGGSAVQCSVEAYVVDAATATITAARRFDGSAPPQTKSSGGSGTGSPVSVAEVAAWIASLPRR